MNTEELVAKYIPASEQVLNELQTNQNPENLSPENVKEIIKYARAYLRDAKYYQHKEMFDVGLTSVAYCEGLLDALRLLGLVKFEWPKTANPKTEKEEK